MLTMASVGLALLYIPDKKQKSVVLTPFALAMVVVAVWAVFF